jgi:hypothetical protein
MYKLFFIPAGGNLRSGLLAVPAVLRLWGYKRTTQPAARPFIWPVVKPFSLHLAAQWHEQGLFILALMDRLCRRILRRGPLVQFRLPSKTAEEMAPLDLENQKELGRKENNDKKTDG